ncbi:Vms1/Ankzf1 family peptidyl-tRNA hydrolase [Halarchaeum salinum]|uniref:Vms1/Ankzf1 family peptidyl-tRNA hydrolase n=1 Tax=Halarchaeum salinum TaxID=489912 RepID=A0AAV3SB65_9EURY
MLDRLLGRASLKERIAELEDETDSLRAQLDAENERRREAVAARNEAEETINRLEDRITELEDRVERAESGNGASADYRAGEALRGARLDDVLGRLAGIETDPEGALTAMVPDEHDIPKPVSDVLGERAPLVERAAPCIVCVDDASLVAATLAPPLAPDAFCEWGDAFRLDRSWFVPTGRYALALVRADLFAVGVYDATGDAVERVHAEGFESDVKAKHSKGGFSQSRFERRRESQIDEHLDDARDALAALDDEYGYDACYVTGQTTLLGEFDADARAPSDASGDPREALGAAARDFWSVPYHSL